MFRSYSYATSPIITRTYQVEAFTRLQISGAMNIRLTQGDTCSLSITSHESLLERLSIDCQDGLLQIRAMWQDIFGHPQIDVAISYSQLTSLVLSGACTLHGNGQMSVPECMFHLTGASSANLSANGQLHRVHLTGASTLQLSGSAEQLFVQVGGASKAQMQAYCAREGDLEATGASSLNTIIRGDTLNIRIRGTSSATVGGAVNKLFAEVSGASTGKLMELATQEAQVQCRGASTLHIDVAQHARITAAGTSTVLYRGNPTMDLNVTGTSTVKHI